MKYKYEYQYKYNLCLRFFEVILTSIFFHTFLPFNTWFNIPGEYCDISLFITVKYVKINLRNEITKIFFSGPVPGKAVGREGGKVDSHAWGKTGRLKPLLLNLLSFLYCFLLFVHYLLFTWLKKNRQAKTIVVEFVIICLSFVYYLFIICYSPGIVIIISLLFMSISSN